MNLPDRIKSFELLGDILRRYHEDSTGKDLFSIVKATTIAASVNPWFTPEHIRIGLNNLGQILTPEKIHHWLSAYKKSMERISVHKDIGVVMAGNIPAVGFHDFLCVLISGHKLTAKLSSSDNLLLPAMANILFDYLPEWHEYISFTTGKLENFDAILATGNSNTSRYFEFYFAKYPHIIRKSRNSIAVLTGDESILDLQNLADDIMLYFGMGCRSISKVFVPSGYDFSALTYALGRYEDYANHNKYRNNYEYFKSIFMLNQVSFLDTGFLLIKEDVTIPSRISVLHYEYYKSQDEVEDNIRANLDLIQCVISKIPLSIKSLSPGEGQNPALSDYSDHIDTMEFLLSLK